MTKNLVIFGSNSILAKNFIEKSKDAFKILGIRREEDSNDNEIDLNQTIKFNIGSIKTKEEILEIITKINEKINIESSIFILFSWAGKTRKSQANENIDTWQINMNIAFNFLEFCGYCKPSQVIFISTAGGIYDQKENIYAKESHIPSNISKYGSQKLFVENLLRIFSKTQGFELAILRLSSAYGYDPRDSDQGVINKWLKSANKKNKLQLYNSIDSIINFISFDQISQSITACIDLNINGLFNIGATDGTSLSEIINFIEDIYQRKMELDVISNQPRYFNLDVDLFSSITGLTFNKIDFNQIKRINDLVCLSENKIEN